MCPAPKAWGAATSDAFSSRERFLHSRILLLCPPRHLPEASSQHLLFAPLTPPPFSISSEWHVHL